MEERSVSHPIVPRCLLHNPVEMRVSTDPENTGQKEEGRERKKGIGEREKPKVNEIRNQKHT